MPDVRLAPVELLTSGRPSARDRGGEEARRGRLAVRRRDERDVLVGRELRERDRARSRS